MKKEITKSKTYTAYYMPSHNSGNDPTKSGFPTKKLVEEYIISRACYECREEGMSSACAAEWLVVTDRELKEAQNFNDLFIAAGYKKIK